MQRIDELLDKAIKRIKNGESISSVIGNAPEELQEQLRAMLEIVALFSTLPIKDVPTPNKRRLFLDHQPENSSWYKFGQVLRKFKVAPVALGIFFLTIAATAFGAASSLPGDTLFGLKKTVESARVSLATSPQARADLQLALADQRIQEAQQVLASNSSNDQKKQAAALEVKQQTSVALNDLKSVGTGVDASALAKAEHIAKAQQKIVAQVTPNDAKETKEASKVALQAIQDLVASSHESSGAELVPSVIDVTGQIDKVGNDQITIGKNNYIVDEITTEIKDKDGNDLTFANLEDNDTVKIEGSVVGDQNVADTVTVLNKLVLHDSSSDQKDNKGKGNGSDNSDKSKPNKPTEKIIKIDLQSDNPFSVDSEDQAPINPNPQDTHAGFIVEPPANPNN